MSSQDNAIIEVDVVLTAKATQEIDEAVTKLKGVKEKKATAKGETEADEFFSKLDDTQLKQLEGLVRNPTGAVGDIFKKLLGGAGGAAKLIPILAIAISAPIVIAEILKALSVKGGPFNRDWRRLINREVEVGLSRLQQKQKELGINQLILTQIQGFKPNNEAWTYNSYFEVDAGRLARIGLSDRAAGVLTE